MRRTDKSTLLRLIANDMTATLGRPESSFVFLNFERPVLPALRDPLKLHDRIVEAAARSPARLRRHDCLKAASSSSAERSRAPPDLSGRRPPGLRS